MQTKKLFCHVFLQIQMKKKKKPTSIRFDIDIDRYCLLFPQRIIRANFEQLTKQPCPSDNNCSSATNQLIDWSNRSAGINLGRVKFPVIILHSIESLPTWTGPIIVESEERKKTNFDRIKFSRSKEIRITR